MNAVFISEDEFIGKSNKSLSLATTFLGKGVGADRVFLYNGFELCEILTDRTEVIALPASSSGLTDWIRTTFSQDDNVLFVLDVILKIGGKDQNWGWSTWSKIREEQMISCRHDVIFYGQHITDAQKVMYSGKFGIPFERFRNRNYSGDTLAIKSMIHEFFLGNDI